MSMPTPKLKSGGAAALDKLLEEKLAEGTAPSIFWAATNAEKTIYENQAGYNVMGDPKSGKVHRDTTLEMYSMTKFITSIAALQLVDQGKVALDHEEQMYKYLPELSECQVIQKLDADGYPLLEPSKYKITLRMLMDHTSGFVAPKVDRPNNLQGWAKKHRNPWILSSEASIESIKAPTMFQPGTSWMYGSGLDWVGILISRITDMSLEDYFRKNIFDLVEGGMPDTTFYPRPDIKERKAGIYKWEDGKLIKWENFGVDRPNTVEEVSKEFLSGAGGLYGSTKDYLALLRAVLQCDPRREPPSNPLLSGKAYKLIFEPSLRCEKSKIEAAKMFSAESFWSPDATPENSDHSVACSLNLTDSNNGRKAGSGSWSGMAHTHFWLDPTTGIAATCNTQITGPNPLPWNKIYNSFERALYDNLQQ